MGTETKFNCTTNDGACIAKLTSLSVCTKSAAVGNCENGQNNGKEQSLNGSGRKAVSKFEIPKQTTSAVPFVPIHIDENNVVDGAKELLKFIRPDWNLSQVQFKKFTDGITNKLVGCFNTETTEASNGSSSTTTATTSGSNGANGINGCNKNKTTNGSNGHAIATANGNATNGHSSNNGTTAATSAAKATTKSAPKNGHLRSYDDNDDSGNLSDSDSVDSDTNSDDDDNDDAPAPAATAAESEAAATNSPKESCSSNVVLVRVYGNKTDLLIDRKAETRNILLLHSYGFAPPLYATFKNGLAYDYVPGVTLNTNNILRPNVWRLVACRMAEMHRIVNAPIGSPTTSSSSVSSSANSTTTIPMLWKKTQSFLDLVPERFSDATKHKRLEGTFLPIARMRNEFAQLYKRLEALGSPLVFAHNDLLLGNVVYNESLQTVNFIDYEYADYNFQAFDIGNHFAEFAGVDEVDYSRYPTRDYQYEWLRVYLQVYLQRSHVSDAEVHRLYVQVNQFSLAAHFFWTIWSLIQAEHSKIDFDYVEYAFVRYTEYLARKDAFLALDLNGSS